MNRGDGLVAMADIARVAADHPDLGVEVVRALRRRFVWSEVHEPSLDELRAYVDRVSSLGPVALRLHLGLVKDLILEPGKAPVLARDVKPVPPAPQEPEAPAPERPDIRVAARSGRGRPRGSRLDVAAIRSAYASFRTEHHRRPSQFELASQLDVAQRTLQRFLRSNGVAWPPVE